MSNDTARKRRQFSIADAKVPAAWVDREVADCEFKDERLDKRFRSLLGQLSSSPGDSIPLIRSWIMALFSERIYPSCEGGAERLQMRVR